MGRICNYSNWSPAIKSKNNTILSLEYYSSEGEQIDLMDEKSIIDLAQKELYETGLINTAQVLNSKLIRLNKCYPLMEIGYKDRLDTINRYLDSCDNIFAIGRYGSFNYINQDHSILMGMRIASKISGKTDVDTWEANSDASTYIENNSMTFFENALSEVKSLKANRY